MAGHQTLSLDVDGRVARITLTRPELMNRFDEALHEDLLDRPRSGGGR